MFLIYNGKIIPEADFRLPLSNRAFQYNDGFFETIILEKGKIRFWPEHQERMQEAAELLKISLPPDFVRLPEQIMELSQQNNCGSLARVKLKVWRSGAGLYTPEKNEADWLLTAQPTQEVAATQISVGICHSIPTNPSPFSSFKGINSPVYVLASQEKAERKLDDLILLSPQGNVAELTYSNIFWWKENTLFTPALQTGCLNGVMRRRILNLATQNNIKVEEGFYKTDELLKADVVFGGNVTGFRVIQTLEGNLLSSDDFFLEKLNHLLQ